LQTKNHDLEVARDDAEYRFLELDEKTHKILADIESINSLAQATRELLKPKLPEPPPVQEPVHAQNQAWDPQGQSEPHPTGASSTPTTPSQSVPTTSADSPNTASQFQDRSESAANPSPSAYGDTQSPSATPNPVTTQADATGDHPSQSQTPISSQLTPMPSAEGQSAHNPSTSGIGSPTSPSSQPLATSPSGRYAGRNYYDHPVYVPREEWLAEGGTNESYDWRPASRQSAE
jgi:hypothetical protein